jgi:hypothetical protein
MTTGGAGIPRLQEVSYLEVAAQAVHDECTFEDIRRRLVAHMTAAGTLAQGSGNTAVRRNASDDPTRYVHNVTEALKELMKLGLLEKAILPSTAGSAYGHRLARYRLTEAGESWVNTLVDSRRAGYDQLTWLLLTTHPQFRGFLTAVGTIGGDEAKSFIIPLSRWGDVPEPRTRRGYIAHLAEYAAHGVASINCGWRAPQDEIADFVTEYVDGIAERAAGRGKADPFARNQAVVTACEEAMVKFAFGRAGMHVDSISVEILRRWTGTLALANFSYHAPGPQALRFWPTAAVEMRDGQVADVRRRVGEEWRARVPSALRTAFDRMRRNDPTGSLWIPIYRIRAAVCWELRIPDSEFDTAVYEMLRGERGTELPFRVNLDPSSYGSLPPSERPLIITTRNGPRVFRSLSLVARAAAIATSKGPLS